MNSIYLTCRMHLRQAPTVSSQSLMILEKDQVLPVMEIMPKCDGYFWFRTPQGYVANVDEVFYHADSYQDTEPIKKFVSDYLDGALASTEKAVAKIKEALDQF